MASNGLDICYVLFDFDSYKMSPTQFRGFMAHLFANVGEFHHHSENPYHYPLIQYKKIDGKLAMVGIGNYAPIVSQNIPNIDHITTKSRKIPLRNIQVKHSQFVLESKIGIYSFTSPWVALNEANYTKYRQYGKQEKKKLLEKILVGNILSMFKGMGVFLTNKVEVCIIRQDPGTIMVHENKFIGFKVDFVCNITMPEYMGLGKSVSKGFGVIRRIHDS